MSQFTVVDHGNENVRPFDSRAEAEDKKHGLKGIVDDPNEIEVVQGGFDSYGAYADAAVTEDEDGNMDVDIVDMTEDDRPPADPGTPAAKAAEPEPQEADAEVAIRENPIEYLRSINNEFVNTIKGTPAISKQGFRYIQVTMGIVTTAEVVETFDDPVGVVVHARAEMPDGRYAEAHGEGYLTESGVDDNEFVRYADTRAKNRALSDLTSSGALAESEL